MKKLLLKIAFLAFLVVGTLSLPLVLPTPYGHTLSLLINKVKILRNTPSPRYVLVGGSGIFGGFDSALLAKESGMGVVNMGFYVGFGMLPLLEIVGPELRSGDIVLLIPEYQMIADDFQSNEETRKWLLAASPGPRFKGYLHSAADVRFLIQDLSELLKSKLEALKPALRGVPSGYAFAHTLIDARGDALIVPKRVTLIKDREAIYPFHVSSESLRRLNLFSDRARSSGADVMLVWPASPIEAYENNRQGIGTVRKVLRGGLSFNILGEPRDFLYSNDMFLDTVNHLDARGKALRTEKVISLLKSHRMGMSGHEPAR